LKKSIILQIDGGIGKNIAATAVCAAIKKQYPDDELIVLTGYPEVFFCNPNLKVFGHNEGHYFYQQYVENRDIKVLAHNPYLETSFIKGGVHLIQTWCEMFGIDYNGELPELFINSRELNFYTNVFSSKNFFARNKPIMVIQTNGGAKDQSNKYSWVRDLPVLAAQKVVDTFANDYTIVHLRRDDQLQLKNVISLQSDFRSIAVLIGLSSKRLFIDSFGQHTAAALGKPSVVCMIDQYTNDHFGYDMHTAVIANAPTVTPELRHSKFSRYNIIGNPIEFPYNNESEIYDVDKIVQALIDTPGNQTVIIKKTENNLIENVGVI